MRKFCIPYIPYRSLLLSTTVLNDTKVCRAMECSYVHHSILELKQISESVGYPFEIYYPDSDPEAFRIVANYFKQF